MPQISQSLYAAPLVVDDPDSCYFYHRMEIPGHGVVGGDARRGVYYGRDTSHSLAVA